MKKIIFGICLVTVAVTTLSFANTTTKESKTATCPDRPGCVCCPCTPDCQPGDPNCVCPLNCND